MIGVLKKFRTYNQVGWTNSLGSGPSCVIQQKLYQILTCLLCVLASSLPWLQPASQCADLMWSHGCILVIVHVQNLLLFPGHILTRQTTKGPSKFAGVHLLAIVRGAKLAFLSHRPDCNFFLQCILITTIG